MKPSSYQLSEDEFPRYFRDVHVKTPFKFSSIRNSEVTSTVLSSKYDESQKFTYSNNILKFIINLVSLLLTNILNKSLVTCCSPMSLKIAQVVHIFKAGDRRVSTLPVFRKIF